MVTMTSSDRLKELNANFEKKFNGIIAKYSRVLRGHYVAVEKFKEAFLTSNVDVLVAQLYTVANPTKTVPEHAVKSFMDETVEILSSKFFSNFGLSEVISEYVDFLGTRIRLSLNPRESNDTIVFEFRMAITSDDLDTHVSIAKRLIVERDVIKDMVEWGYRISDSRDDSALSDLQNSTIERIVQSVETPDDVSLELTEVEMLKSKNYVIPPYSNKYLLELAHFVFIDENTKAVLNEMTIGDSYPGSSDMVEKLLESFPVLYEFFSDTELQYTLEMELIESDIDPAFTADDLIPFFTYTGKDLVISFGKNIFMVCKPDVALTVNN